ncbi:hypothetical protein TREES_T100016320 [Tupaia chinensis]|uniref:Uncharacterized protein n=1 Tax=Tupaia chinensis TaxID=246437 RepID=L9JCH5_TUPCH|nr:hypothetical protein TREES_T100016320 [Tupaia chinensis]
MLRVEVLHPSASGERDIAGFRQGTCLLSFQGLPYAQFALDSDSWVPVMKCGLLCSLGRTLLDPPGYTLTCYCFPRTEKQRDRVDRECRPLHVCSVLDAADMHIGHGMRRYSSLVSKPASYHAFREIRLIAYVRFCFFQPWLYPTPRHRKAGESVRVDWGVPAHVSDRYFAYPGGAAGKHDTISQGYTAVGLPAAKTAQGSRSGTPCTRCSASRHIPGDALEPRRAHTGLSTAARQVQPHSLCPHHSARKEVCCISVALHGKEEASRALKCQRVSNLSNHVPGNGVQTGDRRTNTMWDVGVSHWGAPAPASE